MCKIALRHGVPDRFDLCDLVLQKSHDLLCVDLLCIFHGFCIEREDAVQPFRQYGGGLFPHCAGFAGLRRIPQQIFPERGVLRQLKQREDHLLQRTVIACAECLQQQAL